jgi:hypothetical protein
MKAVSGKQATKLRFMQSPVSCETVRTLPVSKVGGIAVEGDLVSCLCRRYARTRIIHLAHFAAWIEVVG